MALRMLPIAICAWLAVCSAADGFALREFPTGEASAPTAVVAAPGNAIWFTDASGVNQIDAVGRIHRYPVNSSPADLAAGPDGDVWFIDADADAIGHLTPDGRATEFATKGRPSDVAVGSDGNAWYIDQGNLGRVKPSGLVTVFPLARRLGAPRSIAAGPDGRLWIAQHQFVDAVDTGGALTRYALRPSDSASLVAAGPDGRMWVATDGGALVEMNTDGSTAARLDLPDAPAAMVSGPGKRIWMTFPHADRIADVTAAGQVTEHGHADRAGIPMAGFAPEGLAVGGDGRLWVSEPLQDRVARITTGPACTVPALVGQREAPARVALKAAGCRASVVRPPSAGAGAATIASQSLAPGRVAPTGTAVRVILGTPATTCRLPLDATEVVADADAIVARRFLSFGAGDGTYSTIYIGCARATGRVLTIGRNLTALETFSADQFHLAGTRFAYASRAFDQSATGLATIQTGDLLLNAPTTVVTVLDPQAVVDDLAVTPAGAVSWIDELERTNTRPTLHLWVAGAATTLDVAGPDGVLLNLSMSPTSVHWTKAGDDQSAPIPG